MLRQGQSIPAAALGPEYSADVTVVMQSVIRLLEDWKSFWVKEASDAATRAALKDLTDELSEAERAIMELEAQAEKDYAGTAPISTAFKIVARVKSKLSALAGEQE